MTEVKLSQNASPLPKKKEEEKKGVSFGEAALMMVSGKKIHRIAWPEEEYGFLMDGFMAIHRNGKNHHWLISDGDITGDDYVEWEEPKK